MKLSDLPPHVQAKITGHPVRQSGSRAPHKPGLMNGTEKAYAERLEILRITGRIAAWRFEAIKFRLAGRTFYTPDFMVVMPDGQIEFHEVKGHWEDDARVKIKVAAETFPEFHFVATTHKSKQWITERF